MPYYEDLSPYQYHHFKPNDSDVNIGWLDRDHPFNQGPVDPVIISKIGELCKRPVNQMRGYQYCCFGCAAQIEEALGVSGEMVTIGDAEIRVIGQNKTYNCPTLIYHYMLRHSYQPPQEFLDAVQALLSENVREELGSTSPSLFRRLLTACRSPGR